MRKMLKSKKKKGFTLIEMVAVIAIIGILAAVLVPKVMEYMKDAKRTKVVAQARTLIHAVETAKTKGFKIDGTTTLENLEKVSGNITQDTINTLDKYLENNKGTSGARQSFAAPKDATQAVSDATLFNKLHKDMEVNTCKDIADGINTTFTITDDGRYSGIK